jgi:hypothetical protein
MAEFLVPRTPRHFVSIKNFMPQYSPKCLFADSRGRRKTPAGPRRPIDFTESVYDVPRGTGIAARRVKTA